MSVYSAAPSLVRNGASLVRVASCHRAHVTGSGRHAGRWAGLGWCPSTHTPGGTHPPGHGTTAIRARHAAASHPCRGIPPGGIGMNARGLADPTLSVRSPKLQGSLHPTLQTSLQPTLRYSPLNRLPRLDTLPSRHVQTPQQRRTPERGATEQRPLRAGTGANEPDERYEDNGAHAPLATRSTR